MPWELQEHAGRHYAVLFHYALPDDAWAVELSEAVPASAKGAENPDATETYRPGAAFLVALVPDEDPNLQPAVRVYSPDERVVPYEITLVHGAGGRPGGTLPHRVRAGRT